VDARDTRAAARPTLVCKVQRPTDLELDAYRNAVVIIALAASRLRVTAALASRSITLLALERVPRRRARRRWTYSRPGDVAGYKAALIARTSRRDSFLMLTTRRRIAHARQDALLGARRRPAGRRDLSARLGAW